MKIYFRCIYCLLIFTILLIACTPEIEIRNQSSSETNTDTLSSRAFNSTAAIPSNWLNPLLISEKTLNNYVGGNFSDTRSNANSALLSSFELSHQRVQFAIRPSIDMPWDISGPNSGDLSNTSHPRLFSHPLSVDAFVERSRYRGRLNPACHHPDFNIT